jgi:ribosomal protein S18 acetylase RimI-like enzyme
MNIHIEKLKTSDLPKYKYLIDECFDVSHSQNIYDECYDNKSEKYEILVGKTDDNKIIASLTLYKIDLFTFDFQPSLEIFNVCVSKKYRGQKIAKKLFTSVFKFAKENGYKSIYLTCLDSAIDAHRLYESLGMKKTNSVKYFIKI